MKLFVIILSLLFLISGCSDVSKCDKPSSNIPKVLDETDEKFVAEPENSEDIEQNLKYLYISGIAIDGYVSGATVKIAGKELQTDSQGRWTLKYDESEATTLGEVSISGGIDISTGEMFEGELKVFISEDDVSKDGEELKPVPATPLTTIVTAMISTGLNESEAEQKLADSLGFSPEIFSQDPVAILKTGSPEKKLEAAKAIKKALIIQKFAESMTKTITGESSGEDAKLSAFDSVMNAVAKKIVDGKNDTKNSFDSIMNDTDSIAEETVKQLEDKLESGELQLEEINLTKTTTKLKAIGEVAKAVTTMLNMIDEMKLASGHEHTTDMLLESTSKACEIITLKVEEK